MARNFRRRRSFRTKRRFVRKRSFRRSFIRRPLPEVKTLDSVITGSVSNVGTSFYLSGMAQGIGSGQRIGIRETIKSLQLQFTFERNNSSVPADTILMLLYVAKFPNGAAPVASDLLAVDINPLSMANPVTVRQFRILKKWIITFADDESGKTITHRKYFKRMMLRQSHVGASAGVGDLNNNGLFIFMMSLSVTNHPQVDWFSRVRYTDV